MPRTALLLLILTLVSTRRTLAAQPRVIEWQRDLDFAVATIEAVHPEPFHRVTRAAFERDAAALRKNIASMSDEQATLALMRLVASLRDGHTHLGGDPILKHDA